MARTLWEAEHQLSLLGWTKENNLVWRKQRTPLLTDLLVLLYRAGRWWTQIPN